MGLIEEHTRLSNAIISGELDKEAVLKEISRIEKEYGKSAFNSYTVTRKSAPWTKADLENLEIQSASGACSKDFYIYMAEVSDYLNRSESEKKKKSIGIALIVFACVIIFCISIICKFINK